MSKYEDCKKEIMHKIVTEYSNKKLKNRSGKSIKNRKQAIAIGLSISEKDCIKHFSKADMTKLQVKVDKFMSKDKMSYSGTLDCIKYINMLKGKKKNEYEYKLITFILKFVLDRDKYCYEPPLNKKIITELIKYFSTK